MNDDPRIPADDRERIDALVADFRSRIENLYKMAWLAGSMNNEEETRMALSK